MKSIVTSGVVLLALVVALSAQPASVLLLKQDRDGVPAQNLSAAELSSLGDPFFNLVLKDRADATALSVIEGLIQPDASKRQTFVVDEGIADSRRGQSRRVVLSFTGSNGSEVLDTNVMLSVQFSSQDFPDSQRFVEAWGWDNHRGRYNYYKLDQRGTPDMRMSWKFRGSSDNADLLNPSDRTGTCMACHVNGAPVMKELLFPWNNWHSFASGAAYLTSAAPPAARWPVASDSHLLRLQGAEDLETSILAAITQFNTRRLNRSLAREDATGNIAIDASGKSQVKEGRRLLRSLFTTTEYNIISARQKSGFHPLGGSQTGPGQSVSIPASFFLNVGLMGQSGPANFQGLGISKAGDFGKFTIGGQEYIAAVKSSDIRLAGRQGDADFAWLVPEPSHVDNDMVDRLLRRGVVSRQFIAAALSIDLENPVFSEERRSLLRFVPDEFDFVATSKAHPDDLTTKVIAAIVAAKPASGSVEARFLEALRSTDPVKLLTDSIDTYHARVSSRLANPQTKQAEIDRLFSLLIQRRRVALQHEVLSELNETGDRLFPVP
jgi:hypothetical protein